MRSVLQLLVMLLLAFLIILMSYFVGFGVNYVLVRGQTTTLDVPKTFGVFWESWRIIKDQFYSPIPGFETMAHGAIKGMLRALDDPNTVLVEKDTAKQEQSTLRGETGDIGLNLDVRNRLLLVVSAIPNSPADKAGFRSGDIILKIGPKDLPIDITAQEAAVLLRGPVGSKIMVTFRRIGEEKTNDLELTREKYALPTVESKIIPNTTFGYIKISLETAETANEFARELDKVKAQKATAIILDLRNNPGGLFPDPVLDIAGQFLKNSEVVVYEKYRDGSEKAYNAGSKRGAADLPVVVLVNNGTASAAEILAGALRDNKRAVLIGEPTYGKGSVQTIRDLSDGASLHITVATWYTPNKKLIEGTGLSPDISVPLTDDDIQKSFDRQLNRAIEYLQKGA
ncbi:MAG: S41 family peptidase [Chloroflexi bacterium]|nr:S41 family peptidase [Chloroflexota bacterium]